MLFTRIKSAIVSSLGNNIYGRHACSIKKQFGCLKFFTVNFNDTQLEN
jgi:hypothetical protein